jgi:hypothetical protein
MPGLSLKTPVDFQGNRQAGNPEPGKGKKIEIQPEAVTPRINPLKNCID